MKPMRLHPAPRHRPARWAAWLVAALLWAQWLGVWHHTLHAAGGVPGLALAPPVAPQGVGRAAVSPPELSSAAEVSPWHHTAGGIECRLLDQLLLGDAAPATPTVVVSSPPAVAPALWAGGLLLPQATLRAYLARGPPAC